MRRWVFIFITFFFVFLSSNYILETNLFTRSIFTNWQQQQNQDQQQNQNQEQQQNQNQEQQQNQAQQQNQNHEQEQNQEQEPQQLPPLRCMNGSLNTCPNHDPSSQRKFKPQDTKSTKCPEYFRWIHEDLKPWLKTGITREMIEKGQNVSHFRLVILDGKAYIEKYKKSFQTRDVFTIWGILQLLRLYPGMVPDLELMFQCGDKTVVDKSMYHEDDNNVFLSSPPPVFHYCGDQKSYDIAFPDWTFWGWAELNIRPWDATLKSIQKGNKMVKWKDREPYAFWKGNPMVSSVRRELTKCNVSDKHDWNARIYNIHWNDEQEKTSQNTKLENQCTYRYKIYAEGATWSVSEKYILACDSMTMFIEPKYFDFMSRSLIPLKHYWPITSKNMCEEIKFAVDWGNTHQDEAQNIGKGGSEYIRKNLKMKHVFDYMFHLLQAYANLMKFKPTIPEGATEICLESMVCRLMRGGGVRKDYMIESMINTPSSKVPCSLPPPYEPQALQNLLDENENLIKKVKARSI